MSAPKPVYLLAGRWGNNPDPVIARVIKESGIIKPTIAYIGASAGDNLDYFKQLKNYFEMAGSGKVTLAPTVDSKADINTTKKIIKSADIAFVSGGDVGAGMDILRKRKLVGFLKEIYENGKPFFAVSAGSILLAREWVRWRDPNDDKTSEIFPCIGIAPVICDTHGESDNWEELIALLQLEKPAVTGYGIVSGNTLKVYPDGNIEAVGGAINRFVRGKTEVQKLSDILPEK